MFNVLRQHTWALFISELQWAIPISQCIVLQFTSMLHVSLTLFHCSNGQWITHRKRYHAHQVYMMGNIQNNISHYVYTPLHNYIHNNQLHSTIYVTQSHDNMLPVSIQSQNSIASCWLSITHLVHPYVYVKNATVHLEKQCSNVNRSHLRIE